MGIITPRSTRAAREVIQVDYAHSCCIFLSINDLPRLFLSLSLCWLIVNNVQLMSAT